MKFLKQYSKSIVILAIAIVFIYGWYEWTRAGDMEWEIWESGGWYDSTITYMQMHRVYELSLMKTIMFGGFVFGSLLLLLNLKKK